MRRHSIVHYTDRELAREEYPSRIVSPLAPANCCVEQNRIRIGRVEAEQGDSYFYKRCRVCGHTVRFFFSPRHKSTSYEIRALIERPGHTIH